MKKITAILLIICLTITILPLSTFAADYDDAQIQNLLSMLDIMVGDDDGNFRADDPVTRAEFTKVAVMASKYRNAVPENSTTAPFGDVPYSLWSAPYITLAVDNGLLSGYPDSTFRPENTVLLEEAVTICLKLLGYTEADYGKVWPSGPMSLARSLDLLERMDKSTGEYLNRRDVMYLIYNTINTKSNGSQSELIEALNYTFMEDTVLIATQAEDPSVSKTKIVTSNDTYKIGDNLDLSFVGRRGDAFIKNGDTLVSFIPDEQTFETHAVYTVLNDDIIVYDGGFTSTLDIDSEITCYSGSKTETVSSCISRLETGDAVKLAYDSDGDIDYIIHFNNVLKGPYTVSSEGWMNTYGISSDAAVIKNGKTVSASEVEAQDVIYYAQNLNLVWAYDDKVIGTYTKAEPNQENPTSVTISGNTYAIESSTAFNKLSSNGSCKLGDTVTVLLGRNGEIADVLTSDEGVTQYGYLIETGTKEFPSTSGNTETSNYVKIVTADGTELELKTSQDYKNSKNQVVLAQISNGSAKITTALRYSKNVSGLFSTSKMTLGSDMVADNVQILDVMSYADASTASGYITVYPQRLNGAELRASDIIFATYNEQGKIDRLFLNDVTGDGYSYGIATDVSTTSAGMQSSGSYTCNLGGTSATYNRAIITQLAKGDAVQAMVSGNSISELKKLNKISKSISKVSDGYAYASSGEKYVLGDNVLVYKRVSTSSNYNLVDLEDVDWTTGSFSYYYNNTLSAGGRIRVIVWTLSSASN